MEDYKNEEWLWITQEPSGKGCIVNIINNLTPTILDKEDVEYVKYKLNEEE